MLEDPLGVPLFHAYQHIYIDLDSPYVDMVHDKVFLIILLNCSWADSNTRKFRLFRKFIHYLTSRGQKLKEDLNPQKCPP